MAFSVRNDLFRGAGADNISTSLPAFRAQINDMICNFDHIHIVFDDQNRVAPFNQTVQHFQEDFDVFKVKSGSRFIKDIKRLSCIALGQLRS